jgi:hypothetical protein
MGIMSLFFTPTVQNNEQSFKEKYTRRTYKGSLAVDPTTGCRYLITRSFKHPFLGKAFRAAKVQLHKVYNRETCQWERELHIFETEHTETFRHTELLKLADADEVLHSVSQMMVIWH